MHASRFAVAATLLLAAACSSERKKSREHTDAVVASAMAAAESATVSVSANAPSNASSASAQPSFREGPNGEVWMKTTNGTMLMGLRHDSILVGFSDSLRKSVKADVDSSMKKEATSDENSAIGRVVKNAVQATVKSTLTEVFDREHGFPLSDVKDVKYDDGRIVFDYRHKPTIGPENVKDGNKTMLEQFHPADAARFVGAVRARLKSH